MRFPRPYRHLALVIGVLAGSMAIASSDTDTVATLLHEGQAALDREQYAQALEVFREAYEGSRDSAGAGEALYWQAFSLYRLGGTRNLREAAESLEHLLTAYQDVAKQYDVAQLAMRIRGRLADRGDLASIALVEAKAHELQQRVQLAKVEEQMQERLTQRLRDRNLRLPEPVRELARVYEIPGEVEGGDDIRLAALTALADLDDERALPILASVLERRDEESRRLRTMAVAVLTRYNDRLAVDLLLKAARQDPDPAVRRSAVLSLGRYDDERVLDLLEEILTQSEDPQLRMRALQTISTKRSPRVRDIVRDIARDETSPLDLREFAVQSMIHQDREGSVEVLKDLFTRASDPDFQSTCIMVIGSLRNRDTRDWLIARVQDSSLPSRVREVAFYWVANDDDVRLDELVRLYDQLDSVDLRRQAVLAIGQRDDDEVLDFILRVAEEEEDLEIRRAAVFWLGMSDDDRAVDYLEKLLLE